MNIITMDRLNPEIYQNYQVILWGCGEFGRTSVNVAKKIGVDIFACVDSKPEKWGTNFFDVPVISPEGLEQLVEKGQHNTLIELALNEKNRKEVLTLLDEHNAFDPVSVTGQNYLSFFYFLDYFSKCNPKFSKKVEVITNQYQYFLSYGNPPTLNIYSPEIYDYFIPIQIGKTGDMTITNTFNKNAQVRLTHCHSPSLLHKEFIKNGRVKITTAVREPVSRALSGLYQVISTGELLVYNQKVTFNDFAHFLEHENPQFLFDMSFGHGYKNSEKQKRLTPYQNFFTQFKENIVNVLDYPFDQEKGYTIIREGNYDIFFYQLEKLNDLVPELSQWMGVPFDKLEKSNEASGKWIAESYAKAKKEITFSQEYFDACYNDPYVQHCYSPEDIAKFKRKWESHIR